MFRITYLGLGSQSLYFYMGTHYKAPHLGGIEMPFSPRGISCCKVVCTCLCQLAAHTGEQASAVLHYSLPHPCLPCTGSRLLHQSLPSVDNCGTKREAIGPDHLSTRHCGAFTVQASTQTAAKILPKMTATTKAAQQAPVIAPRQK